MRPLALGGTASLVVAALHVAVLPWAWPFFEWTGVGDEMHRLAAWNPALPYVVTVATAAAFAAAGTWVLSAAGVVRPLPRARVAATAITAVYLARALGGTGAGGFIEDRTAREAVFSLVALAIGALHAVGLRDLWATETARLARLAARVGQAMIALGVVHVAATPIFFSRLGEPAVWFVSGGLALALVGVLNLLPLVPAWLLLGTNLGATAFVVLLGAVVHATLIGAPQVLLALALAATAACLVLARPVPVPDGSR